MEDGDLQAAALKDIGTRDATLSVWKQDAEIGIDRMVAAIVASGTSVAQLDYVLLDIKWLEAHGLKLANTPHNGLTPDCGVNELHYDVKGLTIFKLYDLAFHMSPLIRAEGPIIRDQVAKLIDDSIAQCHIDEKCLNDKLLISLRKIREKREQRK